jgi:selenide, water dikinase
LILSKPLGVGVLSAALKKEKLSAEGYKAMIDSTTKLNKPGIKLGKLPGVRALTDVTGFALLGHLLEICKGSKTGATIDWNKLPLIPGVLEMAKSGFVTGASGRNWDGYGKDVLIDAKYGDEHRNLLTDPQTSGGLLVACDPAVVDEVLAIFAADGFEHAAVIGEVTAGEPKVTVK